jgi:hypothetical protein
LRLPSSQYTGDATHDFGSEEPAFTLRTASLYFGNLRNRWVPISTSR